jgi:hypothetical protein
MTVNVIQHTKPRRKRGGAWSWTTQHIVLLGVVIVGIVAASWLAPEIIAPPSPAPANIPQRTAAEPWFPPVTPDLVAVDIAADLAGAPLRDLPPRQTARHSGVPLDAPVTPSDEYEILSAAELDGISQARN